MEDDQTDIYDSSSGPKHIPSMNYHNLTAAYAKLVREAPSRQREITRMAAEIAKRDAEFAAEAERVTEGQPQSDVSKTDGGEDPFAEDDIFS